MFVYSNLIQLIKCSLVKDTSLVYINFIYVRKPERVQTESRETFYLTSSMTLSDDNTNNKNRGLKRVRRCILACQ